MDVIEELLAKPVTLYRACTRKDGRFDGADRQYRIVNVPVDNIIITSIVAFNAHQSVPPGLQ